MNFWKKYQPCSLDELLFANENIRRRLMQYAEGRRAGNIILHGEVGTAKSTTARLIVEARIRAASGNIWASIFHASALEQKDIHIIKNDWNWQRLCGVEPPYVVIEEVNQLSQKLQQCLRSVLDENSYGHVILTTNHLHAVDVPLVDRCDEIELTAPQPQDWLPVAKRIVQKEGVSFNSHIIAGMLRTTNGSARDILSTLEDYVIERR